MRSRPELMRCLGCVTLAGMVLAVAASAQPVAELASVQGELASVAVRGAAGTATAAHERMLLLSGDQVILRRGSTAVAVVAYADGRRVTVCHRDWGETCQGTSPYRVQGSPAGSTYAATAWRSLFRGLRIAHDRHRTAASRDAGARGERDDEPLRLVFPPGHAAAEQWVSVPDSTLTLEWSGGTPPFVVSLASPRSRISSNTSKRLTRLSEIGPAPTASGDQYSVRVTDGADRVDSASVRFVSAREVPHPPRDLLAGVPSAADSGIVSALYLYSLARARWRWEACRIALRKAAGSLHTEQLCWAARNNLILAK